MPTNPKDYTNLRTLLDSLEVGALRYFLSGTGMSQPQKFRYLKETLTPIIEELWHPSQGVRKLVIESECPPGYYDCDGVCVPYKCPDIVSTLTRQKAKATKRKR